MTPKQLIDFFHNRAMYLKHEMQHGTYHIEVRRCMHHTYLTNLDMLKRTCAYYELPIPEDKSQKIAPEAELVLNLH